LQGDKEGLIIFSIFGGFLEEIIPEINPEISPSGTEEHKSSSWGQVVRDAIETILLAVILFVVINALSARVRVDGFSMRPTLENGEYVLVYKLAYRFDNPQRGDIVVFRFPVDPSQDLIKRVIGLPGDVVKVANGVVSVNDRVITEPYIAAAPEYDGMWLVPPGQLFVLGDNRNDSSDSHAWGMLPINNVIGKALVIYWPPPEWNLIDHTNVVNAAP
jgi:signal peptidase I